MAKQFLANRSGQNPTLDEVPNETIKIYPTEADLDADLANLEENEIVATDEDNNPASGTQYPVDVVEEDNMNAVTSNAVYNSFKGMSIVECGKIPGREQYDDSWYVKYDSGIIEEWWVYSSIIPAMTGSPIASCNFTVTFPIPLKSGTVALQFDIYNQSSQGLSATEWFGSSNSASDNNTRQSVSAFATYPYAAQSGNVRMHVVGFWK